MITIVTLLGRISASRENHLIFPVVAASPEKTQEFIARLAERFSSDSSTLREIEVTDWSGLGLDEFRLKLAKLKAGLEGYVARDLPLVLVLSKESFRFILRAEYAFYVESVNQAVFLSLDSVPST